MEEKDFDALLHETRENIGKILELLKRQEEFYHHMQGLINYQQAQLIECHV